MDIRSDHLPITATELKKQEGQVSSELFTQHLAKQFNQLQLEIAVIHHVNWEYQLSFSDPAYKNILLDIIVMSKITAYF